MRHGTKTAPTRYVVGLGGPPRRTPPYSLTRQAMFDILEADIVIMQETKIQRKDLRDDMVLVTGWDVFFSLPRHKKGYSGVAIYTRTTKCCPIRAEEGITGLLCPPKSSTPFRELPEHQRIGGYPRPDQLHAAVDEATLDSEGRCLLLEFPAFVLIGVYCPAARDDTRVDFRLAFLNALDARVRNLIAAGKQVIVAGDLNVVGNERDTANPDKMHDDFLATPERRLFNQLVFGGRVFGGDRDPGRELPVMVDVCREAHHAREGMFTCWDTKKNTRPANFGSRIDYILASDGLRSSWHDANIQEGLLGSDHCPVYVSLADHMDVGGESRLVEDVMNPPDMFSMGKRCREWTTKDLLPLSARLIPEFNRRQSIKAMFQAAQKEEDNGPAVGTAAAGSPSQTPSSSSGISRPSQPVSPTPLPRKRFVETSALASRSKKARVPLSREASASKSGPSGRSQSTLMGFFKPKAAEQSSSSNAASLDSTSDDALPSPSTTQDTITPQAIAAPDSNGGEDLDEATNGQPISALVNSSTEASATDQAPDVFDPIQNKESWSKLLGSRVVPRCEHGEPCITLVTKKPGVNCGTCPPLSSLCPPLYSTHKRPLSFGVYRAVPALVATVPNTHRL